MPHYPRTCIALLLAFLPAMLAWASDVSPAALDARKTEVVRQALMVGPPVAGADQVAARIAASAALLNLTIEQATGEVSLVITLQGAPEYTTNKLDGGKTLVLDFANTVPVFKGFAEDFAWPSPIRMVETRLSSLTPEFVSTVSISLETPCPYYIEKNANGLRFTLSSQTCPEIQSGANSLDLLTAQLSNIRGDSSAGIDAAAQDDKPVFDSVVEAVRVRRVADDLRAVGSPKLDYTGGQSMVLAAVDEGASPAPAAEPAVKEAAEAEAKPAESDEKPAESAPQAEQPTPPPAAEAPAEVEPPTKRETPPAVDTTAANAAIAETMRTLIKGLAKGTDTAAEQGLKTSGAPAEPGVKAASAPAKPVGNPLDQLVDFECDEMPLTKVVPLLAYKAGINVVAGADLTGNVTMSLKGVPLRKAIETALRMNGLGLLEEDTIYRIVPYEEAMSSDRTTMMVSLENAKAQEVRKVLEEILKGTRDQDYINLSANDTANVVVVAGPEDKIQTLVSMAHQLDVAEPVLPTITTPIKLNYAEPEQLVPMIEKMLTPKIGNVAADSRARHLIVTDVPVVVEQVRDLVTNLDIPVKQVMMDTMVIDAALDDEAETGVDWLLNAVRSQSYRDFVEQGADGTKISSLQELGLASAMPMGASAGKLTFGLLTSNIDWKGVLQAEVRNRNGHLISNPVVVTVENKPATITISQQIPYIELSQTSGGGSQTNTQFKDVGTVLEVTPRVTHNNQVIVDISGKESATNGEFNGVPIEDQRKVSSTLRMDNGQTIFVGGLRKRSDNATVTKLPVLGDIPVVNFLFRQNSRKEQVNELMIFLTCRVIEDMPPPLEGAQQQAYDEAKGASGPPNAEETVKRDILHPNKTMDPAWKWRRAQ